MGLLRRIFGICKTKEPSDKACWTYEEGSLEINLDRAPELSEPGGALRIEGRALPRRVLVVHSNEGAFYAFGNKCTHMGRRIDPIKNKKGEDFLECCSVSKSTYDYTGRAVSGPTKGNIPSFSLVRQGRRLAIKVD